MLPKLKVDRLNYFSIAIISLILIIAATLMASQSGRSFVKANNQSEYALSCNPTTNRFGGSYNSITTSVHTTLGNDIYLSTKGLYSPFDENTSIGQVRLSNYFGQTGLIYNSSPVQTISTINISFHPFAEYTNIVDVTLYLSKTLLSNPSGSGVVLTSGVDYPVVGDYQYFAIVISSDFSTDLNENIIVVVNELNVDYECGPSYGGDSYDYVFKNDEVVIESGTLAAGTIIPYPSTIPTKIDDDDYTYAFDGYEGYTENMRIYDDIEFLANFKSLAKDPYALMNDNNYLNINVGTRAKNTDAVDEFIFRHSASVSNVSTTTQYVNNYFADLEGTIGDTVILPSYERNINMMITGTGSSLETEATYFGGLYLYAGYERNTVGYTDPIGSARPAAKKTGIKIWSSIYNIENLIFRDIVFHTRGVLLQYGLGNDYLNDSVSNIGHIRNVIFENCTFEDISMCNDQVMYVNNGNQSYHTNLGGCINFASTRNIGTLDIYNNKMSNLTFTDGSAITTRGLMNMNMSYNNITNISYGAWLHSGYGIKGSITIDHNTFTGTGNRMLRVNTKQGHNLFETGNDDGAINVTNNCFDHTIGSASFMKFDNENTTEPVLPYKYEDDGRIVLDMSNTFYFHSTTALTEQQLGDGSKNCGVHSGVGPTTYIDGLYISHS